MLEATLIFVCLLGIVALTIFLVVLKLLFEHVALIRIDLKKMEQAIDKYHIEGFVPPSCEEPERKPKCEFKPFDKVLVRDDVNHDWVPTLYAMPSKEGGHVTTNGIWKYCIPFVGNEDKCGAS